MSSDFEFLYGSWLVEHKRLKHRLAGRDEWEAFAGTCVVYPLLDGQANVDDNVLHAPSGTYRASSLRVSDPSTGKWSIRWIDGRHPGSVEQAVIGTFQDGIGTFYGKDTCNGEAVTVRFRWSDIHDDTATWQQAFSADSGKTWEANWIMIFRRALR